MDLSPSLQWLLNPSTGPNSFPVPPKIFWQQTIAWSKIKVQDILYSCIFAFCIFFQILYLTFRWKTIADRRDRVKHFDFCIFIMTQICLIKERMSKHFFLYFAFYILKTNNSPTKERRSRWKKRNNVEEVSIVSLVHEKLNTGENTNTKKKALDKTATHIFIYLIDAKLGKIFFSSYCKNVQFRLETA